MGVVAQVGHKGAIGREAGRFGGGMTGERLEQESAAGAIGRFHHPTLLVGNVRVEPLDE